MSDELAARVLTAWAAKNLPARLDVVTTAKLLGFAEHDIQILMAARKLTPLGDPAQNAPKWFAAIEIMELAADKDWLHKATKEVSKYWRHKRERRSDYAGKVSPDSSPKVTPAGQKPSGEEAIASDASKFQKAA
jgi:hypothetical protein